MGSKGILFSLFAVVLTSTNAQACQFGSFISVKTFYDEVPQELLDQPVIAKIKIIEASWKDQTEIKLEDNDDVVIESGTKFARAQVIESLGEVIIEDEIILEYQGSHSCSGDHDIHKGDLHFVAGNIEDGRFVGSWATKYRESPYEKLLQLSSKERKELLAGAAQEEADFEELKMMALMIEQFVEVDLTRGKIKDE